VRGLVVDVAFTYGSRQENSIGVANYIILIYNIIMKNKVVPKAVAIIAAFFLWTAIGGGIHFLSYYIHHYYHGDLSELYIPGKHYIIDLASILFTIFILFLSFLFQRHKK
jgi:hypothetical protein